MRSANASFSHERGHGAAAAHDQYSSSLLQFERLSQHETSFFEDGDPVNSSPDAATGTPLLVQEVMARRRMLMALEQEADSISGSRRNSGIQFMAHQRTSSQPIVLSELQRARAEREILTARLATAEEHRVARDAEVATPPPQPPRPPPAPPTPPPWKTPFLPTG